MEWISVDDELPEEFESVLAYRNGRIGIGQFYIHNSGESGFVFNGASMVGDKYKFSHWMPLPNPPKEE